MKPTMNACSTDESDWRSLADAGLSDRQIARDIVAQVLGTRIPVARPLPGEAAAEDRARVGD